MLKRRSEVNRERSPIGHRGFPGQQFGGGATLGNF